MAFNVAGLVDYVNQNSTELLTAATFKGRSKELCQVRTGIKLTDLIPLLTETLTYQANACILSASGDSAIAGLPITVGDIAIVKSYCAKTLIPKFTQMWLKAGSEGEVDMPAIYAKFAEEVTALLSQQEEVSVWQGDILSGNVNLVRYDGWLKHITAGGTAIVGNPTAITVATGIVAANVISILQRQYQLIPASVLDKPNLAIRVGADVFRTYQNALVNANLFAYSGEGTTEIMLPGTNIPVQLIHGLTGTNRIITGSWDNFYWGTDLVNDSETFEFRQATGLDKNHYLVIEFKSGTACAYMPELVNFVLTP